MEEKRIIEVVRPTGVLQTVEVPAPPEPEMRVVGPENGTDEKDKKEQ